MQLKVHRHDGQLTVDDLMKLLADFIDDETTKSLYENPNNNTPHRQDRPRPEPRTSPTSTMLLYNHKIVWYICSGEHVFRFYHLPVNERIKIVEYKGLCKLSLRKHVRSHCIDLGFFSGFFFYHIFSFCKVCFF